MDNLEHAAQVITDTEPLIHGTHLTMELIEHEYIEEMRYSVIKTTAGVFSSTSFETSGFKEMISDADTYIQVIEGTVLIDINGRSSVLKKGESIMIPAHHSSHIRPNGKFTLLRTAIKKEQ